LLPILKRKVTVRKEEGWRKVIGEAMARKTGRSAVEEMA
jgi:hypothetical protein